MSQQNKIKDIFGKVKEAPEAINVEEMVQPGFNVDEYIPFEEVNEQKKIEPGEKVKNPASEDMFSGDIDDALKEMEKTIDEVEVPQTDAFGLDDLDAEMLVEMWEDVRLGIHSGLYNWAIYKEPKKARKMAKELSLKENRTEKEIALLKQLWDYIDKHDEIRTNYMAAIPYSEKHRDLFMRFIKYQIKRLRVMGKELPTWLIWAYILVVPEVKVAGKFFALKDEIPEFKFDLKDFG